jgi:SAM-dependent methyltransferase
MSANAHASILDKVATYYATRLADHGATPRGVDWNGVESHELRHRQFLRLIDDPTASVLDLGCGFGDFLRFLRQAGHHGSFVGYDIAQSMIEEARRLHGEAPDTAWKVGPIPDETADFAVASGVFNVKGEVAPSEWKHYVEDTIEILANASRRGFAFNDPDRRRPDLYYADPVTTFQWCLERFGRSVAILQDYGLYEFTVVVRHGKIR